MKTAVLYHDGCNLCLSISETISNLIDETKYSFQAINLGMEKAKGHEAKAAGVKRLPSLVLDGKVIKIDDHSSIDDYIA